MAFESLKAFMKKHDPNKPVRPDRLGLGTVKVKPPGKQNSAPKVKPKSKRSRPKTQLPKDVPVPADKPKASVKPTAVVKGIAVRSTPKGNSKPTQMSDLKKLVGTDPSSTFPGRPTVVSRNNKKLRPKEGVSGKSRLSLFKLGDGTGLKKARSDIKSAAAATADALVKKEPKFNKNTKWDNPQAFKKATDMSEMKKLIADKTPKAASPLPRPVSKAKNKVKENAATAKINAATRKATASANKVGLVQDKLRIKKLVKNKLKQSQ